MCLEGTRGKVIVDLEEGGTMLGWVHKVDKMLDLEEVAGRPMMDEGGGSMDLEARVLGTNLKVHGEETPSSLEEFGQVLPKFRNERFTR